jgi:hypothetical protein
LYAVAEMDLVSDIFAPLPTDVLEWLTNGAYVSKLLRSLFENANNETTVKGMIMLLCCENMPFTKKVLAQLGFERSMAASQELHNSLTAFRALIELSDSKTKERIELSTLGDVPQVCGYLSVVKSMREKNHVQRCAHLINTFVDTYYEVPAMQQILAQNENFYHAILSLTEWIKVQVESEQRWYRTPNYMNRSSDRNRFAEAYKKCAQLCEELIANNPQLAVAQQEEVQEEEDTDMDTDEGIDEGPMDEDSFRTAPTGDSESQMTVFEQIAKESATPDSKETAPVDSMRQMWNAPVEMDIHEDSDTTLGNSSFVSTLEHPINGELNDSLEVRGVALTKQPGSQRASSEETEARSSPGGGHSPQESNSKKRDSHHFAVGLPPPYDSLTTPPKTKVLCQENCADSSSSSHLYPLPSYEDVISGGTDSTSASNSATKVDIIVNVDENVDEKSA